MNSFKASHEPSIRKLCAPARRRGRLARWMSLAILAGLPRLLSAAAVDVPNNSFESPVSPPGFPAFPFFESWLRTPQPPGVPLPGGITWEQLSGVFPNTPAGAGDHIDNMEGNQAAYLFNIPGLGIFQDLSTPFGVGQSYHLTMGAIGGGGGMPEGSTLLLGLYYRDAANDMVMVSGTPITHSLGAFPNTTHFVDFQVDLPTVLAGDAWAGRNIGVKLIVTAGTGVGYWDVDNVRLVAVPEPGTLGLLALGAGGLWAARRGWRRRA